MEMPWMDILKKHLGEHEIAGRADNQWILDCFKHTSYHAGHDEVPWCAACACRVLEESGYRSTKNAAAASFSTYGQRCALQPGAVVVFHWATGGHHVTFCHHVVDSDYVACIGGNQSDSLKISVFNRKFIEAVRWPVKAQAKVS
jgi:uncharacterized protein (TIGR02594 family)